MSFFKVQKLRLGEDGNVLSGSASLVASEYVKGKNYHSKQVIIERLGKIIWLPEDRSSGIFYSPTRGLIECFPKDNIFQPVSQDDKRIINSKFKNKNIIHTIFGDVYWLLTFMAQSGMTDVITKAFPDKEFRDKVIIHILHTILHDNSRVTCDNFVLNSFIQYLFTNISFQTLKTDSDFFEKMGDDNCKVSFFKSYVNFIREKHENFGKGCYVDSTPLPNDIKDNPLNELCSHGTGHAENQLRLVLILDKENSLPVWFTTIAGNIVDINTVRPIVNDVLTTLDIDIDSFIFDAGYVSKQLINDICKSEYKSFIGRMPARRGYHYKDLYHHHVKPFYMKGEYHFDRRRHRYFGKKASIDLF